MTKREILKRLYRDYTKKYLNKILLSAFFSILVAGSTSSIAWLLDPAIKKIFIDKDQSLIIFIPLNKFRYSLRNSWELSKRIRNRCGVPTTHLPEKSVL